MSLKNAATIVVVIMAILLIAISIQPSQLTTAQAPEITGQADALAIVPLSDGRAMVVSWDAANTTVRTSLADGFSKFTVDEFQPGSVAQIAVSACGSLLWVAAGDQVHKIELDAPVCNCAKEPAILYLPIVR